MTRILRAVDHRRMPWKNGGGETIEIAVSPGGAGLDDFDWRLSMARVAGDGPFSAFAGIDRTLAVLTGQGMRLAIAGLDHVTLTQASEPLSFPGDASTSAVLVGGPITDLNLMTRRGRLTHRMRRVEASGQLRAQDGPTTLIVFCAEGGVSVALDETTVDLAKHDAVCGDGAQAIALEFDDESKVFVIEIYAVA